MMTREYRTLTAGTGFSGKLTETHRCRGCNAEEVYRALLVAEERGLVRRTRHSTEEDLLDKVKRALKKDPYALMPVPPQLLDCVPRWRPVSEEGNPPLTYKLIVQIRTHW